MTTKKIRQILKKYFYILKKLMRLFCVLENKYQMNNKFSVVTVSMLLCSQIFNNNTFLGRQQGNHFEKLSTEKIFNKIRDQAL